MKDKERKKKIKVLLLWSL